MCVLIPGVSDLLVYFCAIARLFYYNCPVVCVVLPLALFLLFEIALAILVSCASIIILELFFYRSQQNVIGILNGIVLPVNCVG